MSLDVITKLKTAPKIKSITVTEGKSVVIRWTEVDGAEKYSIKKAVSDGGEFEHIAWSKKPSYTDEDVKEDITYRYKIMAYKKLEGKKTSTKLSAVKAVVISDIPAVLNAAAQSVKGPAIKLTWDKCEGADEYIINRRNDFYSQILPVARTDKSFFTDEKTVWGQPYHYSVQPVIKTDDGERQGNFSQEVHSVCLDKGQIIDIRPLMGKRVRLTLRIVTGADCYCIERSEGEDGEWKEVIRTKNALEYTVTDKVPSAFRSYRYRVRAVKTVAGAEFFGNYCDVRSVRSR